MTCILLTNDDGVDAPAVVPFARALERLGTVSVVVPDRERSWVGKAITRVDEVSVARTVREGLPVMTCTGYPADAAQLGIHVLCDPAPDLVVSGINLGFNHGAAFLMSSGTVGAAIEGWISGIPAVAFSTGVFGQGYQLWREFAESPNASEGWRQLADTCTSILEDILSSGLVEHADVVSVNLPFDATPATPRRLTSIARIGYDRLFRAVSEDVYQHDFTGLLHFEDLGGSDVEAAQDGVVSITPVRLPQAARVPEEVRALVEGAADRARDERVS